MESRVETRPLGKTGLNVSILAQGGAAFGQQFGPVSAAEAAETVHAAIDAGVNLVDTAAYYGRGLAEEFLGKALAGGRRDKVYICTKSCRLGDAEFDFTPAGTRKSFEASAALDATSAERNGNSRRPACRVKATLATSVFGFASK